MTFYQAIEALIHAVASVEVKDCFGEPIEEPEIKYGFLAQVYGDEWEKSMTDVINEKSTPQDFYNARCEMIERYKREKHTRKIEQRLVELKRRMECKS